MRKKKLILRVLAFLIVAAAGAAMVNPYFRQLVFGPTYQGVPLCVWQESLRRQSLGESPSGWLAKATQWFQPKHDKLPFDKLTRDERITIWMTLLNDPVPAMRVRVIQSLWGGNNGLWGRYSDLVYFDTSISLTTSRSFVTSYELTNIEVVNWGGSYLNASLSSSAGLQPPLPVNATLIVMLDDSSEEVRAATFRALSSQGSATAPAWPRLLELLNHTDSKRRIAAADTLNSTHPKTRVWLDRLLAMLDDDDAETRITVIACLASWNDRRQAVAAGPPLVKSLQDADPRVRLHAATALGTLRVHLAPATATLRAAMRHPEAAVRRQAISSLFDPAGKQLYEDLVHCARSDPDENVQVVAIQALSWGGDQAVPLLIALLRHPKAPVRQAAIGALNGLGRQARAAVPYLLSQLEEQGVQVVQALRAIGDTDAIPKLIELLDHRDANLRGQALAAFHDFGAHARPARSRLLAMVRDQERDLWAQALGALIQIDPDDEMTLALVEQFARSNSAEQRNNVQSLVLQLGPKMRALAPLLVRRLDDKDDSVRLQAIRALAAIGPAARAAVPALLRLLDDRDSELGANVIAALGDIGAAEEQVVPLLIELMRQDKFTAQALSALRNFGSRAAAAVPDVRALLKHADHRLAAAYTLCAIQPRADDVLPHLLPLLDDPKCRGSIAGILGEYGPAARAAVPALCALLDDDNQSLCDAVLEALARIEP